MSTNILLQAIRQITPAISADELKQLLPALSERKINKGEHLVMNGSNFRYLTFIVTGALRLYHISPEGNETNILLSIDNNFINDYESLLHNKPADYNIQATADSELILIDYNKFEHLLSSTKNWEHCGRMINQYVLMGIFSRVQSLLFLTPEQRYIKLLKTEPYLLEKFSQEHIASYIGVKRESLSRIRNRIVRKKRI